MHSARNQPRVRGRNRASSTQAAGGAHRPPPGSRCSRRPAQAARQRQPLARVAISLPSSGACRRISRCSADCRWADRWRRPARAAGRDHRFKETGVVVAVVARKPGGNLLERAFREDGDAVECLLAMHRDVVAERLQWLARKGFVDAFRLLQADHVRLALREPGQRLSSRCLTELTFQVAICIGSRAEREIHARARVGDGRKRARAHRTIRRHERSTVIYE